MGALLKEITAISNGCFKPYQLIFAINMTDPSVWIDAGSSSPIGIGVFFCQRLNFFLIEFSNYFQMLKMNTLLFLIFGFVSWAFCLGFSPDFVRLLVFSFVGKNSSSVDILLFFFLDFDW
jgi:hypothetical protein